MNTKLLLIFSGILYGFLAYFVDRQQIAVLLITWGVLFAIYFYIVNKALRNVVLVGLLLRLIWVFAIPALSDDFYRFVWDGRLLSSGYNPFLYLPSDLIGNASLSSVINAPELFKNLNSPEYYTVYPPLNQYIFAVAAFLSNGNLTVNVILLRISILLAEVGTLSLLVKLNKKRERKINIAIYALNPLIIIELTGNLHFEAVVIFFLVLSYYLLKTNQSLLWAAIAFAAAVCIKLVPLIFLPAIVARLKWKKGIFFSVIVGFLCLLLFLPLLNIQFVQNILKSVNLYFKTFEFNGSIYYVVREIGFKIYGYNIIGTAGRGLSVLSLLTILVVSFYRPQRWSFIGRAGVVLTSYLFFATTVHPWYVTPLILAACFTNYRYALVWSALIPLTYFSYTTIPYKENLWLVGLEYVAVMGFFVWEISKKPPIKFIPE